LLFYGILGIFFATFMFPTKVHNGGIRKFKLGFALLIYLYSAILILGFASGGSSIFKPLENIDKHHSDEILTQDNALKWQNVSSLEELEGIVANSDKPLLIDFWATWCVVCKELDKTLSMPSVKSELENFTLIIVDVTKASSEVKEMMKRFNVYGPPVIVFFKDGIELKSEQSVGYLDESQMLEKLRGI
ncbi:MAG: thioredoxin fold domain-containing protein, partial [Campylobacter sp.]|nr:thioredoxin fold domain-containing protein [Campylobacter sp.]